MEVELFTGFTVITFLKKKIEEDGARPNLGLDFGGVLGDFWKIESLSYC